MNKLVAHISDVVVLRQLAVLAKRRSISSEESLPPQSELDRMATGNCCSNVYSSQQVIVEMSRIASTVRLARGRLERLSRDPIYMPTVIWRRPQELREIAEVYRNVADTLEDERLRLEVLVVSEHFARWTDGWRDGSFFWLHSSSLLLDVSADLTSTQALLGAVNKSEMVKRLLQDLEAHKQELSLLRASGRHASCSLFAFNSRVVRLAYTSRFALDCIKAAS